MFFNSLNEDSMRKIRNIERGFKAVPMYQKYELKSYLYDMQGGVYAIMLLENGNPVNLFLFYPGGHGEINSIAIFGAALDGHLQAIRSSMTIFGMPVSSAQIEHGADTYVDVYIDEY